MTNELRGRFAAVGATLPAAMLAWRAGRSLFAQAGNSPAARRWARIGAVAAGLASLGAVVVGMTTSTRTRRDQARLDDRLDGELAESFPASDPPSSARRQA